LQQKGLFLKLEQGRNNLLIARFNGKIVLFKERRIPRSLIGHFIEALILEEKTTKLIAEWTGNVLSTKEERILKAIERQDRKTKCHEKRMGYRKSKTINSQIEELLHSETSEEDEDFPAKSPENSKFYLLSKTRLPRSFR